MHIPSTEYYRQTAIIIRRDVSPTGLDALLGGGLCMCRERITAGLCSLLYPNLTGTYLICPGMFRLTLLAAE
jgi:hypothetical protein